MFRSRIYLLAFAAAVGAQFGLPECAVRLGNIVLSSEGMVHI